jgi:AraC-like DNA-binding protein
MFSLMIEDHLDASTAASEVSYESPSQFSHEYSRMFGAPPLRDIKNLAAPLPIPITALMPPPV